MARLLKDLTLQTTAHVGRDPHPLQASLLLCSHGRSPLLDALLTVDAFPWISTSKHLSCAASTDVHLFPHIPPALYLRMLSLMLSTYGHHPSLWISSHGCPPPSIPSAPFPWPSSSLITFSYGSPPPTELSLLLCSSKDVSQLPFPCPQDKGAHLAPSPPSWLSPPCSPAAGCCGGHLGSESAASPPPLVLGGAGMGGGCCH